MEDEGIPEIAQCARLGHELGGIRGIYTHVKPEMIQRILTVLETRWLKSLSDHLDGLVEEDDQEPDHGCLAA